jgi:predicted alpha/beta superfamily hydrolase
MTFISAQRELCLSALVTLALTAAPLDLNAADAPAQAPAAPMKQPDIRERHLTTRILHSKEGLDYTIFISAPEGPPPSGGFPVLYVLDANAWFGLAAEIARLNELEGGPSIVVGVGYPVHTLYDDARRNHDFTLGPPLNPQRATPGSKFGGAAAFLDFLRHDLRDAVGKTHAINSHRQTLFGHSLGGYFVLHALFVQPDAFATFVAASPAIWWDDIRLKAEEKAFTSHFQSGSARPSVLMTVGGLEQELGAADAALITKMYSMNPAAFGGGTLDETLARIRASQAKNRMIDNAREMADRLKTSGVNASFVVFDGDNHRSEVPSALSRTLPLALKEEH